MHLKNLSKLVNFCVAILILKMVENKQHFQHIVLYYFRKGKSATEMQKKKKRFAQCMEKVLWLDGTCQKWFAKFCAGDFLLVGAPWSSRPIEVDSDQIETLIENNQRYTMKEIADILKISKSMKLLVKMKNVPFILWKKWNRVFGQPSTCSSGQ